MRLDGQLLGGSSARRFDAAEETEVMQQVWVV